MKNLFIITLITGFISFSCAPESLSETDKPEVKQRIGANEDRPETPE